jgi:YHS domain-containing protein
MTMRRRVALTLAALVLVSGCAVNNVTSEGNDRDLMLRGYDPVSYFEGVAPRAGLAALTARFEYGTYRFASPENRARFQADPARFAPQYGAFCAKGVSYAIRAGGDPLVYEVRDGRLFIFAVPYARDFWRTDPVDMMTKADHYWKTELADRPARLTNLRRWAFRVPHYRTYPEEFAEYTRRTGKPAPR